MRVFPFFTQGAKVTTEHGSRCLLIVVEQDLHVMDVFVPEESRRVGECLRLLEKAAEYGEAQEVDRLILHTPVDNVGMRSCAERAGFVVVVEDVHMEKELKNDNNG